MNIHVKGNRRVVGFAYTCMLSSVFVALVTLNWHVYSLCLSRTQIKETRDRFEFKLSKHEVAMRQA